MNNRDIVQEVPALGLTVLLREPIAPEIKALCESGSGENPARGLELRAQHHLCRVRALTPRRHRKTFAKIGIHCKPTRELNAFASRSAVGTGFEIRLNTALFRWSREVHLLIERFLRTPGSDERVALVELAADKLASMFFQGPLETYSDIAGPPTQRQLTRALIGEYYSTRFVVAHEVAHILLGHLAPGRVRPNPKVIDLRPEWSDELAADAFALDVALREASRLRRRKADRPEPLSPGSLADLALLSPLVIFLSLECFSVLDSAADQNHPPFDMRISNLKIRLHGALSPAAFVVLEQASSLRDRLAAVVQKKKGEETPQIASALDLYERLIHDTLSYSSVWDYESAVQSAEQAEAIFPDVPFATRMKAVALGDSGRRQEAADIFRALVERDPQDDELRTNLALNLRELGDRDGALEQLRIACKINTSYVNLLAHFELLYESAEYSRAATVAKKLISHNIDDEVLLRDIAEVLYRTRDFSSALSCLDLCLAAAPNDDLARLLKVDTLFAVGRDTEALDEQLRAKRMLRGAYGAHAGLIAKIDHLLGHQNVTEALQLASEALTQHPDNAHFRFRVLYAHIALDQNEEALAVGGALGEGRADPLALVLLGHAKLQTGSELDAQTFFERALKGLSHELAVKTEDPGFAQLANFMIAGAEFYLGICRRKDGKKVEALELWRRSYARIPDSDTAGNLTAALLELDEIEEVIRIGHAELSADRTEHAGVLFNLGCAEAIKGDIGSAWQHLQRAFAADPATKEHFLAEPSLERVRSRLRRGGVLRQ